MDHKIKRKSKAGRPPQDLVTRTSIIKVRVDPYLINRIDRVAATLQLSRSDIIRQGVLMYLDHIEKEIPEVLYR